MTQALSPEEEVPKISPTMRMDDIERIVALGRCLIGSINLDLHLESISAGQAAFGNAKSTPWIRVSLDEGSSRYVKVDKQAGRSQATPPAEEICDLTVNQNAKPATHTYMEMLSILSAGLLPRDPTEAEEQRIRASAITLSGAEGAAQDVLDRFSTKGSNTAIEELITATKVLYELFAINARQAAYLVAGATLLGLWPAELVRNASANEPPGDGPHRMVEGIRSALGLQPTGLQDALRSEPLDFAVAPLLLIGNGDVRVLELVDALADDAAKRLKHATEAAKGIWDYQEEVFFAIPAALASMMISNAFHRSSGLDGVRVSEELVQRDRQRHSVNTERWVRMSDALAFQAADIITGGRAWAQLRLQVEEGCREGGPDGARAAVNQIVRGRLLPRALGDTLLRGLPP